MPNIRLDELEDLLNENETIDPVDYKRNVRKEKKEFKKKLSQSNELSY